MTTPEQSRSTYYVTADVPRLERQIVAFDEDDAIKLIQHYETSWSVLEGATWTVRKVEKQ